MLGPLVGLADDDDAVERYRYVDPNEEAELRKIIRRELVPYYRRWDEKSQEAAKLALRYVLSFHPDRLGDVFDSVLPPFDAPDDAALFFEWLWDELFPSEDYRLDDPSAYRVREDVNATNRIKLAPAGDPA